MASTKALLEQLDDLSDRLRDQGEKQAELLKRRNDLLGKVHENGDLMISSITIRKPAETSRA